MNRFVVFRRYKQEDEPFCKRLLKNGVMALINPTFFQILIKETIIEIPIFMIVLILILLDFPIIHSVLVIPTVAIIVYIILYIKFLNKANEIQNEISDIPRLYMSSNSTCFWVAEAYENSMYHYHHDHHHQEDQKYVLMTEVYFNSSNIDVSSYTKKIVGTIALCKSYRMQNNAWIKRLFVHKDYRKNSIGSYLLNIAIEFGILQGYNRVNLVISEYRNDVKKLCITKGFELYLCYKKYVFKELVKMTVYELTYRMNYYLNEDFSTLDPYYTYYLLNP